MAKPRELKRRIRSVQNTRKITKTMELVSTSKLKRAQDRVVGARPYAQALAEVIGELYSPELAERFPLLRQPGRSVRGAGVRRSALLLITSNRGLCGAFNSNLIREARRRLEELEAQDTHTELHLVGKKGVSYFKFTRRNVASQRVDIGDRPTLRHAEELVQPLMDRFAAGDLDAVDVVFAKFNSAVSTPPTTMRILPVTPPTKRRSVNYILEPSAEEILDELLPLYVQNQFYRALVETAAAEHGARRTAMKNATDAGQDMLTILQRTFNRARQAQITQELAEIVGGAEALKG
ncbi:MAG: ATP synthase F1 subunit gamma [Gemmatimonadetes bacterium 13_2_20CM_2_65_7]|nr:MAG: ATP synthase F1 subunit gamma [Gemmatimonadetes bacterium 13_2_20CM_2_65_7]